MTVARCAAKALVACVLVMALSPALASAARQFPQTSNGIYVFSDQLDPSSMNEALFKFAATHYVGSQKLLTPDARHLRRYNPNFLVLHYRLGQGLGFRSPDANCNPTGGYLQIIDGIWSTEWPGAQNVKPEWLFQWSGRPRVYNCNFGWYLMELNDQSWRQWWSSDIIEQLTENDDDGVFADSYSVPNYGFTWKPALPLVDPSFESAWAQREHNFTDYMRGRFAGRWKWIPNIGSRVTTRDPSDYSNVDGAMVEQFAEYGCGSYLATSDWQLQMNRVLPLVSADKDIIAQTYPCGSDVNERLFDLGSYLLIKGNYTYVNFPSYGLLVQWFPEYGIDLGPPADPLPADISAYFVPAYNAYARHYAKGIAIVNPGANSTGAFNLGGTFYLVVPSGGGIVPPNGIAPGSLSYKAVQSLNLCAHCAAVILYNVPHK
jgi:putative glycosyl hydrolase-like family 15 (GHL15) protein